MTIPEERRVMANNARRENKLLEMLTKSPEVHVAGIIECQATLRLVEQGKVRIVRGHIYDGDIGGSGVIALVLPTDEEHS